MVSVLMPVYNGEDYLKEAIESVLNQTYKDFEFLIINDGSTDASSEIVKTYKDPRIRFIENKQNIKLIATLNLGLQMSKGKYIARMDCDDVCFPDRLQKQVDFMESNPDIGISGTWCMRSDNHKIVKKPLTHEDIKVNLLRGAAILHPTTIFRKDFMDRYHLNFDSKYIHAEDYELWVRSSRLFKLGNIPNVLLRYRKHPRQVSQYYKKEQKINTMKIMETQLEELITTTPELVDLHFKLFTKTKLNNKQVITLQSYITLLVDSNEKKLIYDPVALKKFLYPLRNELWERCFEYNLNTLALFHKSNIINSGSFSFKLYFKIIKRIFVKRFQFSI